MTLEIERANSQIEQNFMVRKNDFYLPGFQIKYDIHKYVTVLADCPQFKSTLFNRKVSTVKPPNVIVTSRTENCKKDIMNPNNCSRQQWEADLKVVFTANMTRMYISPISGALVLTYHRDAIDKNKFTATVK